MADVAPSDSQEISVLLKAWGNGDQAAFDRLTPLVYAEIHRMARHHMRKERENTMQTTALVHEAYVRLVDAKGLVCQDRTHFFALSGFLRQPVWRAVCQRKTPIHIRPFDSNSRTLGETFPAKPKGMRWRTYNRLRACAEQAEIVSWSGWL